MYDILKKALDEALSRQYAEELRSAADTGHTFSPEFDREMKELVRRTDHPITRYTRYIAVAACAVIAIGCAVLVPRLMRYNVPSEPPVTSVSEDRPDITEADITESADVVTDVPPDDVVDDDDNIGTPGGAAVSDDDDDDVYDNVSGVFIDDNGTQGAPVASDDEENGGRPGIPQTEVGIKDKDDDDDDVSEVGGAIITDDDNDDEYYGDDDDDDSNPGGGQTYPDYDDDDCTSDDDDADDDVYPGTGSMPVIPKRDTFGEELNALIGCSLSDSSLLRGQYFSKNIAISLPVIKEIPPEKYHDAQLEKYLEMAVLKNDSAITGNKLLEVTVGSKPPQYKRIVGYDYSMRNRYGYYFLGEDDDDDFLDEDDEPDYSGKSCVLTIYSDGTITVRKSGFRSTAYYSAGTSAGNKLEELLDPLIVKNYDTLGDYTSAISASADNYAHIYMDVNHYYDMYTAGELKDGSFIDALLKKYAGAKLKSAYNISATDIVVKFRAVCVSAMKTLDLQFNADGNVLIGDTNYYFNIDPSDIQPLVTEYCAQRGLAAPVYYRTLAEYLEGKNFTGLNGASIIDYGEGNYDLTDAKLLKKLYKLITDNARDCGIIPSDTVIGRFGERVSIQPSVWNTEISLRKNKITIERNSFEVPNGFYDAACAIIKKGGTFTPAEPIEDSRDDEADEVDECGEGEDDILYIQWDDDEGDDVLENLDTKNFKTLAEALGYSGVDEGGISHIFFSKVETVADELTEYGSYELSESEIISRFKTEFFKAAKDAKASSGASGISDESIHITTKAGYTIFIESDGTVDYGSAKFTLPAGTYEKLKKLLAESPHIKRYM